MVKANKGSKRMLLASHWPTQVKHFYTTVVKQGLKNSVKIRSVTAIPLNKSNKHIHKDYQES